MTPSVGWALPLVWPLVLTAAGALGYTAFTSSADDAPLRGQLNQELNSLQTVQVPLEQVIKEMVADEVNREQVLRFLRGDVVLVFKRDIRGKFVVEISGPLTMSHRQLQRMGEEFAGELIQQFACNRIAAEMERKGAYEVSEEVNEQGDVVLKMRRWK